MGEAKRRKLAGTYSTTAATFTIPDDLRRDIAKTVRSLDYHVVDETGRTVDGGFCVQRTYVGGALLCLLDIPHTVSAGGMVYRTGPDPRRDVVAYCGANNRGTVWADAGYGGMLGHVWLEVGDDVVDFTLGDWRDVYAHYHAAPSHALARADAEMGAPVWQVEPPDFLWVPRASVTAPAGKFTPEIGQSWYTNAWNGAPPPVMKWLLELTKAPQNRTVLAHLQRCCEHYALKERAMVARQGGTAIRLSHVHRVLGLPEPIEERLIGLRGKVELTPDVARELLAAVSGG